MSLIALQPTLTEQGLQAAFNAHPAQIEVSHIAAGSSGYSIQTNANGLSNRTSLVSEQERTEIRGGDSTGNRSLELAFALDDDKTYWLRELGFYMPDGTLFAIWSDPNTALVYRQPGVPLILGLTLQIDALPAGSVTVQISGPPLEILMTSQLAAMGTAIANLQLEQLRQADQLKQHTQV